MRDAPPHPKPLTRSRVLCPRASLLTTRDGGTRQERHAQCDTRRLNAILLSLSNTVQSISSSISQLETEAFGAAYAAEMRARQHECMFPPEKPPRSSALFWRRLRNSWRATVSRNRWRPNAEWVKEGLAYVSPLRRPLPAPRHSVAALTPSPPHTRARRRRETERGRGPIAGAPVDISMARSTLLQPYEQHAFQRSSTVEGIAMPRGEAEAVEDFTPRAGPPGSDEPAKDAW